MSKPQTPKSSQPVSSAPAQTTTPAVQEDSKDITKLYVKKVDELLKFFKEAQSYLTQVVHSESRVIEKNISDLKAEIEEYSHSITTESKKIKDEKGLPLNLQTLINWQQEAIKKLEYFLFIQQIPITTDKSNNFRGIQRNVHRLDQLKTDLSLTKETLSLPRSVDENLVTRDNPLFITTMLRIVQTFLQIYPDKFLIIVRRAIHLEWVAEKDSQKKAEMFRSTSLASCLFQDTLNDYFPAPPLEWQTRFPQLQIVIKKLLFRFVMNLEESPQGLEIEEKLFKHYLLEESAAPVTSAVYMRRHMVQQIENGSDRSKGTHEPFFKYFNNVLHMGYGINKLCHSLFFAAQDLTGDKLHFLEYSLGFEENEYRDFVALGNMGLGKIIDDEQADIQKRLTTYINNKIKPLAVGTKWKETQLFYDQVEYIIKNYKQLNPQLNLKPDDILQAVKWLFARIQLHVQLCELIVIVRESGGEAKSTSMAEIKPKAGSEGPFKIAKDRDSKADQLMEGKDVSKPFEDVNLAQKSMGLLLSVAKLLKETSPELYPDITTREKGQILKAIAEGKESKADNSKRLSVDTPTVFKADQRGRYALVLSSQQSAQPKSF